MNLHQISNTEISLIYLVNIQEKVLSIVLKIALDSMTNWVMFSLGPYNIFIIIITI